MFVRSHPFLHIHISRHSKMRSDAILGVIMYNYTFVLLRIALQGVFECREIARTAFVQLMTQKLYVNMCSIYCHYAQFAPCKVFINCATCTKNSPHLCVFASAACPYVARGFCIRNTCAAGFRVLGFLVFHRWIKHRCQYNPIAIFCCGKMICRHMLTT